MPVQYKDNLETIFKKYKNKVYRLAISIVHNDNDAEDVMQNTFIKVMRNLKYFRNQANETRLIKLKRDLFNERPFL